ncbi:hypothetical protein ACQX0H_09710 [Corynebacterium diphtheriae]
MSGLAGLVLIIGWDIWGYIYGNMAAVGTGSYRIGTFLLGVGSVLNLFCSGNFPARYTTKGQVEHLGSSHYWQVSTNAPLRRVGER